jgi:CheY-like chemotaxis protein
MRSRTTVPTPARSGMLSTTQVQIHAGSADLLRSYMESALGDPPGARDSAVPRLLVVEDEAVVACDLCDALEALGYEVVAVVGTGEEAVAAAAAVCPTAVLMDIRLAGVMDGIQAAAQIRSQQDIPIVFLSAHSNEETRSARRQDARSPPGSYAGRPDSRHLGYAQSRRRLLRAQLLRGERAMTSAICDVAWAVGGCLISDRRRRAGRP